MTATLDEVRVATQRIDSPGSCHTGRTRAKSNEQRTDAEMEKMRIAAQENIVKVHSFC